jgi:uncharacterized membrane protein YhaH (DUF805 family)
MAGTDGNDLYRVSTSVAAETTPAASTRMGRVRYTGTTLAIQLATFFVMPNALYALPLPAAVTFALVAALVVLSLAVQLRLAVLRVHDTDRSGWWALVALLPLLAYALFFIPGTPGRNRFGNVPAPANGPMRALAATTGLAWAAILLVQLNEHRDALERFREYRSNHSPARVVADNHDHAVAAIEQRMLDYREAVDAGLQPIPAALPNSAAGWIMLIGSADRRAPDGGPAYVDDALAGADADADAVRLRTRGSFMGGDLVVRVERPAVDGEPGERTELHFEDY